MFPCALPWEEERKDRLLLLAIRITPDSCPIHTRSTRLHTVSHQTHILVVLVGPAERHWWKSAFAQSARHPTDAACLLPRRRVGPLLEVQLIQQYNLTSKLRIICES